MKIVQSGKLDYIGFSASLLCALHCAILPILLSLSSFSSLAFLENPFIEGAILLASLGLAATSLGYSFLKHHQRKRALVVGSAGFVIIIVGQFFGPGVKTVFLVLGAIVVATSHIVNLQLCKNCRKGATI